MIVACSAPPLPPVVMPQAKAQVLPAAVAFGRIAKETTRRLTVRNVGGEGSVLGVRVEPLSTPDFTFVLSGETAPVAIDVTATAASAGFKATTLEIVTTAGTVTVPVSADVAPTEGCELQVSTRQLDFGAVTAARTLEVTVRNAGAGVCTLARAELVPVTPVFSVAADQLPLQVLPGEARPLSVRATPIAGVRGRITATLRLGEVEVALAATLGVPCITVLPDDLDFGTVRQGCGSPARTVAIYDSCASGLLTRIEMLARAPEFQFVSTPTVPARLSSTPALFRVAYRPSDPGSDTGALQLVIDGVDYVVTVRGIGEPAPVQTDTFHIAPRSKTDLLVVLDNSASMASHRASVAKNLDWLLLSWLYSGVDLQLGLTSSEPGGPVYAVTSDSPDAGAVFSAKVAAIGTSGSDTTQLLASAVAALDGGFGRPGAQLSVLTISDSDDRSPLPVATYVSQLNAVKPNLYLYPVGPERVTAPAGCSYDGPGGQLRSKSAAVLLGGFAEDICDPNWASAFQPIAHFGAHWFFHLTGTPAAGTLRVTVNGQTPPVGAWRYEGLTNAVIFTFPPEPGSTVVFTYDLEC